VRHEVIDAVRDYFNSRDFILCDTPIFTPAACEGTTTLFPVQYFEDTTAYLTQSGQLYNEANAMALGRVYCFGPTFRAEKSKTRRHLTEFWMVEPEMAYADLDDVIALAEGLVVEVVGRVLDRRRRELTLLERDTSKLERCSPGSRAHLRRGGENPHRQGPALRVRRRLRRHRRDRAVGAVRPAGVRDTTTRRPMKAFYMKPDPAARQGAVRGRARARGLRRDHRRRPAPRRLRPAARRIEGARPAQEAFEWYLDLRRYGSVPHGGFGMGIERVVAWICGLEHVRETIPYPRMLYRLYP
jgi:asparaginyl-tRNA synthetase